MAASSRLLLHISTGSGPVLPLFCVCKQLRLALEAKENADIKAQIQSRVARINARQPNSNNGGAPAGAYLFRLLCMNTPATNGPASVCPVSYCEGWQKERAASSPLHALFSGAKVIIMRKCFECGDVATTTDAHNLYKHHNLRWPEQSLQAVMAWGDAATGKSKRAARAGQGEVQHCARACAEEQQEQSSDEASTLLA
eukprot:scaffold5080_cov20-Tisochrysis_lutea.AAC.1